MLSLLQMKTVETSRSYCEFSLWKQSLLVSGKQRKYTPPRTFQQGLGDVEFLNGEEISWLLVFYNFDGFVDIIKSALKKWKSSTNV